LEFEGINLVFYIMDSLFGFMGTARKNYMEQKKKKKEKIWL
jgi:hypothetical protein